MSSYSYVSHVESGVERSSWVHPPSLSSSLCSDSRWLRKLINHLSADNNTLTSRRGWADDLIFLLRSTAGILIRIPTTLTTTVKLDAISLSGNTVSLTRTHARVRSHRVVRHTRRIGHTRSRAAGEGRSDAGWWAGAIFVVFVDGGLAESRGQLLNGNAVAAFQNVLGSVWANWLWRLDLTGRKWTTLWDVGVGGARFAAGGG